MIEAYRRPDAAHMLGRPIRDILPAPAPGVGYYSPVHYESHQPIINDLEARITTIRDSL